MRFTWDLPEKDAGKDVKLGTEENGSSKKRRLSVSDQTFYGSAPPV